MLCYRPNFVKNSCNFVSAPAVFLAIIRLHFSLERPYFSSSSVIEASKPSSKSRPSLHQHGGALQCQPRVTSGWSLSACVTLPTFSLKKHRVIKAVSISESYHTYRRALDHSSAGIEVLECWDSAVLESVHFPSSDSRPVCSWTSPEMHPAVIFHLHVHKSQEMREALRIGSVKKKNKLIISRLEVLDVYFTRKMLALKK